MFDPADKAMNRFRDQVTALLFLKYALTFSAGWLLVWGAFALVLRMSLEADARLLLWGAAAWAPGLVWAGCLAWRGRPSVSVTRALFDSRNGCGGLLMAAEQTSIAAWRARLPALNSPRPRWRWGRTGSACLVSTLFAVGALWLPIPRRAPAGRAPWDARALSDRLHARIETLEKEALIEPEQADRWREDIARTLDRSPGQDPGKTWETLDHMEKALRETAERHALELLAQAERLAEAHATVRELAELAEAGRIQPDTEAWSAALADLARHLEQTGLRDIGQSDDIADLLSATLDGTLTPEQLRQWKEALERCANAQADRLNRLADAQLIERALAAQCARCEAGGDGEGDSDGVALGGADAEAKAALALLAASMQPGRGGISRNGTGAPPFLGEAASDVNVAYRDQSVRAKPTDANDSRLLALGAVAPETDEPVRTRAGALSATEAAGGSARVAPVLPRHRAAVRRYFERTEP